MSGGKGRAPSKHDIALVQNGIEHCMKKYLKKKEAMNILSHYGNIEPVFTQLVWERLEKENQEYFKAYYVRLLVKDQIMEFNRLLSEQVAVMHQSRLTGITPGLTSNRSHVLSTQAQQISTPISAQSSRPLIAQGMQQLNMFPGYEPLFQSCTQEPFDRSVHSGQIDASPNIFLVQNQNVGLTQKSNGQIVRIGYADRRHLNVSPPSNSLESRPLMDNASIPLFSSIESEAHHSEDSIWDLDPCSLEALAQSLTPGVPADLTGSSEGEKRESPFNVLSNLPDLQGQNAAANLESIENQPCPGVQPDFLVEENHVMGDVLEGYYRPPFQAIDANDLVHPYGDVRSLDPHLRI